MRAAVHGRVCVLDEADKAPVEVTLPSYHPYGHLVITLCWMRLTRHLWR